MERREYKMAKTIALCGVNEEITHTLERYGDYRLLNFYDEPERRGNVKLAYSMLYGIPVALAVVGYSGAEGLAACDYLRAQNHALPILWLCDRREFESEAMRLGVNFYSTGSPVVEPAIAVILKTIHTKVSEGGTT